MPPVSIDTMFRNNGYLEVTRAIILLMMVCSCAFLTEQSCLAEEIKHPIYQTDEMASGKNDIERWQFLTEKLNSLVGQPESKIEETFGVSILGLHTARLHTDRYCGPPRPLPEYNEIPHKYIYGISNDPDRGEFACGTEVEIVAKDGRISEFHLRTIKAKYVPGPILDVPGIIQYGNFTVGKNQL